MSCVLHNKFQKCCLYLDRQHSKYIVLIETIQEEIKALDELKTRLIADAVTGKIDVRDIEVPDFEYVQETGDSSDEDNKNMGDASEDRIR